MTFTLIRAQDCQETLELFTATGGSDRGSPPQPTTSSREAPWLIAATSPVTRHDAFPMTATDPQRCMHQLLQAATALTGPTWISVGFVPRKVKLCLALSRCQNALRTGRYGTSTALSMSWCCPPRLGPVILPLPKVAHPPFLSFIVVFDPFLIFANNSVSWVFSSVQSTAKHRLLSSRAGRL